MPPVPENILINNSAASYVNDSLHYWQREQKKYDQLGTILRRATRVVRANQEGSAQDEMAVLTQVQMLLKSGFGVKRSNIQVEIHKEFTQACLPKIFQRSWSKNKALIKKQFNVRSIRQEVLVVMPRRRGKSFGTAMFAAAMLLAVPSCSCIIFSTGERTAQLLMTVISDMIERAFNHGTLKRDEYHYETNNKETIVFYGPDGTKRTLMCLPGSARVSLFYFFYYTHIYVCVRASE